jgi:pantothenate synthetase
MSEQDGPSVTALRARQSQLARQHRAAADADRVLAEVLASAHAAMRDGVRRLEAIAEEIESAVAHQEHLAVDTPLGVREFQRFLLAKQREITAVVADARELERAKSVVLKSLRGQYGG